MFKHVFSEITSLIRIFELFFYAWKQTSKWF